jgi:hypothetical protein
MGVHSEAAIITTEGRIARGKSRTVRFAFESIAKAYLSGACRGNSICPKRRIRARGENEPGQSFESIRAE